MIKIFSYLKQTFPVLKKNVFSSKPCYSFSDFFKKRDEAEYELYDQDKVMDWRYKKIRDGWQKPLEKKRQRRERLALIKAQEAPPKEQEEKLVIHNPAYGIEYPPKKNDIFAVVEISGFQHKVCVDDKVVSEKIAELDVNESVVFEKVLMIGTKDYTSVGRPYVLKAKVHATVEEQTRTDTIIVFKKRKRKHYKRNAGSRQYITVLRINKIEHVLENDANGVSLI